MQNPSTNGSRLSASWKRFPLVGRLLVLFWTVSLAALAGFAVYIRHTYATYPTPAATTVHKPQPVSSSPTATPIHPETERLPEPPIPVPLPSATSPPKPEAPPHHSNVLPPAARQSISDTQPAIAIVLEGMGYSESLTQQALAQLPSPIALGLSPYITDLPARLQAAKEQQRETYVTLPMQSAHPEHADEGPHALGYGNTEMQDRQELQWCLDRATGATGLTDSTENGDDQPEGGYATTSDFTPIADTIASHGLLYLAGSTEVGRHTHGMTATHWINGDTDATTLDHALSALSSSPKLPAPHVLLMVGPLTPLVIKHLSDWLNGPVGKTFTLVPPSAFADDGQPDRKEPIVSRN